MAQGFREPLEYWMLARDARFRDATYRNHETAWGTYGQFGGGGFAGDENVRQGFTDPRQGLETCGVVEAMRSFEMLTRLTGDPVWADRCEDLAFNSMPAAFDPQQKGTHYITSPNSVQLDNAPATSGQFDNGFAMQAYMPGVHQYRCCPHNYGMGWPYYAQELWLATSDKGLCASLYAASAVRAKVAGGTEVTVDEDTEYPFGETVTLRLSTPDAVGFPLYLRLPRWCDRPRLRINRRPVRIEASGPSHIVLDRTWHDGDTVTLVLPMTVELTKWPVNHDSVSVDRGPLTFSLAIDEKWNRFTGTRRWPEYEVYPESDWNYGLELPGRRPEHSVQVGHRSPRPGANPFTRHGTPIELRAHARKIPHWQADRENIVRTLQDSPVRSHEPVENVTLVPMGAARLRISSFPVIGHGPGAHEWTLPLITASASHVWAGDSTAALHDGMEPDSSVDPDIDFDDLNPILETLTGQGDHDTVRWTGQIEPKYSETYTFSMVGDNGFRLWVDGKLIIDHWVNDWSNPQTSDPITLQAGQKYDITVEYFEDFGGANLHLSWSSASQSEQIVPKSALYVPEGFEYEGPLSATVTGSGQSVALRFDHDLDAVPGGATKHFSVGVGSRTWPVSSASPGDEASTWCWSWAGCSRSRPPASGSPTTGMAGWPPRTATRRRSSTWAPPTSRPTSSRARGPTRCRPSTRTTSTRGRR